MLDSFLEMASQREFLILDTETTGLHDGEICQIAVLSASGEVCLDTYVRPKRRIPLAATRIHGITDSMVRDAPTWGEIVPQLQELLEGRDLVVYNAIFDRRMMHRSAEAFGLPKIDWKEIARWWCAMNAYAEFYGDWNSYRRSYRWQSLSNACSQQRIRVVDAHSALGDCRLTLALIQAMLQKHVRS